MENISNQKSYHNSYQFDFEKSLSTLEDIQLLSEFSISPLIVRAYFYLSEMKRKADEVRSGVVTNYDAVAKVLDEKLESIFSDFFGNKTRYKTFDYCKSTERIDLKKWNLLLEIIPEVLSIVSLFNYYGGVVVNLNDGRILISGTIFENSDLQASRKFIYVVTRRLLRQKILITFNLEKTSKTGLFKLDLKVDISHDETLVYKVNFKIRPDENCCVGFSNIFCQYRTLLDTVKQVGEHNVIEVANNLSIKHDFGIPDLTCLDSANKEILHFSFLFRPVSIILPIKGNLSTDTYSQDENYRRGQDVSSYYRTIDFFSLFNP